MLLLSRKPKGSNLSFYNFKKATQTLWLAIIVLFIMAFLYYISLYLYNYINKIELRGVVLDGEIQFQPIEQMYKIIDEHNKDGFYALDLFKLKRDIKQLPWIETVNLSREWPAILKIKLVERKPFAHLANGGIISTTGDIFYPVDFNNNNLNLPVFFGNLGLMGDVIQHYFKIAEFMLPLALNIKELELMPDQGWRVLLDHNLNLYLGGKELEERLNNFIVAYKYKLVSKINEISYVDLRYTNGIAISWK